jgi:phenylpropionate dioxygenase-like ring-hydroxylating dioxygenase large terminal subunit
MQVKRPPIDWIVVFLVVFFIAFNATVDRYWIEHAHQLPALADSDLFARMFQLYAAADHGYFDKVTQAELALETINSTITQAFNIWLLIALLARWPVRIPLQMAIGAWVSYSVLFNWWCAAIAGFPGMDDKTPANFFTFFAANLPWLAGHLYIAGNAIRIFMTEASVAKISEDAVASTRAATEPPDFAAARNLRQKARAAGLDPNHWYAFMQAEDLKPGQVAGTSFQDEPIAIYRGADGTVRAMTDRCLHRGIALSLGTVKDCGLVCPYHGWEYGESGKLAGVAHELFGRPLPDIRLRTYPARERYGLIWLFTGDAARAETVAMPEIPEIEGARAWAFTAIEYTWDAHHSIIIDNLSDLTHAYLHRRYKPFQDPVLTRNELSEDSVYCTYRLTLLEGPIMSRLLDRSDGTDMNLMELCLQYPYQWGNTGGRVKHWVFLTPLSRDRTRVYFIFYFNHVRVPFTPFHFPQRLMGYVINVFNPIFIEPVTSQDGDAVAWEQEGYERGFARPVLELNPAVAQFQELITRKWQNYLDRGAAPAPPRQQDATA